MVGAGGLLLVAAVVALAGLWWGVGLLGLLLAALGLFRAA
jgi:hypothetical protein